MGDDRTFIRLKLDTDQPIELDKFVAAFTALGSEFERDARTRHPDTQPEATLYVQEVKAGCIEALLFPVIAGALPTIVQHANELAEFVRNYGDALGIYLKPKKQPPSATEAQLRNFADQVTAIANAPDSKLEVAAISIENGQEKVLAGWKFDTKQAKKIGEGVEVQKRKLAQTHDARHKRVVMTFTRSDIGSTPVGKRSGERVRVDAIYPEKSVPLVYASEMAEQQIKHEINEAEDNIYKKAFVVDINAEFRAGKPITYSVMNVHRIVDLDD